MQLSTDRLLLQEITNESEKDAGWLLSQLAQEVSPCFAVVRLPGDPCDAEEFLRRCALESGIFKQRAFLFMVCRKETKDLAGICRLAFTDSADGLSTVCPDPQSDVVIRAYTRKSFRGMCYMSEALHELLPFIFYNLGAKHVYASCEYKNLRARRLFMKSGFQSLAADGGRRKMPMTFVLCREQFRWEGKYTHPMQEKQEKTDVYVIRDLDDFFDLIDFF